MNIRTTKQEPTSRSDEMKQVSPRVKARITGFVYLMIFLAAPSGAASATPIKMAINLSCDLAVAFLLYDLLRSVSRSLSLLAALFRLIFIILMAITSLNYFGLSGLFQQPRSADAFDAGYGIALVPFAISCVLIGYLVFRSTFLPRILGVLMGVAGGAYLIFLCPHLAIGYSFRGS